MIFLRKGIILLRGGIAVGKDKDKGKIVNGNMTNTMEDIIFLGKQMENMRDEQQLEETGRINDPVQFDKEDHLNS